MFDVRHINFADGVYFNGKVNGAEVCILDSFCKADIIIKDLKLAVDAGYDPNEIIDNIMEQRHLSYSDLSDVDRLKIKYEIEDYYRRNF